MRPRRVQYLLLCCLAGLAALPLRAQDSPRLDTAHDWLYRSLQQWIAQFDRGFARVGEPPLEVPPSMLRIDFEATAVHGPRGSALLGSTDVEATVHLPNIERRLRLFITSEDLQESPTLPAAQGSSLRSGLRYEPAPNVDFELGARAALRPSAFGAFRWTPGLDTPYLKVAPLLRLYADSRLGYGASGGVVLERWQRRQWIVRSSSYADWLHETSGNQGLDWSQTVLLGWAPEVISEHQYGTVASGHDIARGAILRLYVAGDRRNDSTTRELSVLLKRSLHGGWLYGYAEPLVRWNHASHGRPDLGLGLGVDVLFSGPAAR